MVVIATAGATIAFKSTALGFAIGWGLALILRTGNNGRAKN